jgi:S-formylglutathione hydrolase
MSASSYEPVLRELSKSKCFGGHLIKFAHHSALLKCEMKLSVFVPREALGTPVAPAIRVAGLVFLSGLTCNEDNFITKAGAIRKAAELKLALVCPDTSPRGVPVDGDSDSWDFGVGAGFYVNATVAKWANYQMYDYVARELPQIIARELPIDESKLGISGHSMGGHGALVIGLRENRLFKCISAFAPICEPTECAWGQKAFGGYLGDDRAAWAQYDACALLRNYTGANSRVDVLVDQGTEDKFLKDGQLRTDALKECAKLPNNASVVVRMQHGYDHSYWFISTFIDSHLEFHAERLYAKAMFNQQDDGETKDDDPHAE